MAALNERACPEKVGMHATSTAAIAQAPHIEAVLAADYDQLDADDAIEALIDSHITDADRLQATEEFSERIECKARDICLERLRRKGVLA